MKLWILYGFLSLVFMGVGNFLLKWAGVSGQPTPAVMTAVFLVNGLFGLTLLAWLRPELATSWQGLGISAVGGLCLSIAIVFLMLAYGEPEAKTAIATALLNTNFALVAVLSFFILNEALSLKQLIGLGVVLVGLVLLV